MGRRRDTLTPDLLSWEPPKVTAGIDPAVTGSGRLQSRIAKATGAALRYAKENGVNREAIAKRMTDWLGRSVSVAQLDKWAAESSAEHRIPLDAFAALIAVTECHDLLGLLPSLFGFAVVPEKYADIIELHLIEEHEAEVARRKQALAARLKGGR